MQPAVFLDRDNTLIVGNDDLGDPEQVRLIEGVAAGIHALRDAGYAIVVITNQGGVARGKFGEEDVDAVNQRIAMLVDEEAGEHGLIDRFYYCPYHPDAVIEEYRRDHPWRKPHPGMLLQAARDLELDLGGSWMVGDQPRDIEAGSAAGCRTVLLHHGSEHAAATREPTASAATFPEAIELILRSPSPIEPRGELRQAARSRQGASPNPKPNQPSGDGSKREGQSTGPADVSMDELERDAGVTAGEMRRMRRAMQELVEEIRVDRVHRSEFTALRLLAGVVQLLVLLCVLQGLLEVRDTAVFLKWMAGAMLIQLTVIALLIVDLRP